MSNWIYLFSIARQGIKGWRSAEWDDWLAIVMTQFWGYPEQPAVQEHRILNHFIHPHSVQIQQLQINVLF